jgi:hypothetical protein
MLAAIEPLFLRGGEHHPVSDDSRRRLMIDGIDA